jgi:hypothetical protein
MLIGLTFYRKKNLTEGWCCPTPNELMFHTLRQLAHLFPLQLTQLINSMFMLLNHTPMHNIFAATCMHVHSYSCMAKSGENFPLQPDKGHSGVVKSRSEVRANSCHIEPVHDEMRRRSSSSACEVWSQSLLSPLLFSSPPSLWWLVHHT